jgi:hypothetical protein
MLAAGAAALLLAMNRANAKAPASAAASLADRRRLTPAGRTQQGVVYANGQTMGELLARTVNRAFEVYAPLPQTVAAGIGTADARAAARAQDPAYYGWVGPTIADAAPEINAGAGGDPYAWSPVVDGIPAGPVYDLGQDFSLEPWLYKGPGE